MTDSGRFIPEADDADLRREKARARELRQSAWWKRRIAAGVCHYCRRAVGTRALTLDHVVPLIRGGRSVRGNMVRVLQGLQLEEAIAAAVGVGRLPHRARALRGRLTKRPAARTP